LSAQDNPLAWEIANAEARLRRGMVRIIGLKAAKEITLTCFAMGETLRFGVSGATPGISDDQFEQLQLEVDLSTSCELTPLQFRMKRGAW
jgi:hypothetical protein